MLSLALLVLPFLPQSGASQDPLPAGVVATWQGGQISEAQFEGFLGRTFKNKQTGLDALQHLLQIQLVEREAKRRGLIVPTEMVDRRVEEARLAAEEQGENLEQLVVARGLDMPRFRKLLGDSILHEIMAKRDLGLRPDEIVDAEDLQKWSDIRLRDLLAQAAGATPGYAIDTDNYSVTTRQVGAVLRQILGPIRKTEHLEQMVLESYLPAWAKTKGKLLTDDILEVEIQWRRQRVSENPAYGGASYEQILKTQGATVDSVRQGSELRLAGYLRLYSQELFNDAWFAGLNAEMRQQLEDEYGEKRRVSWILLRATEVKKTEIDLDFAEAAAELQLYQAEIQSATDFADKAEGYSEHEDTRRRRGEVGWITLTGAGADPMLGKAAFAATPEQASGPFKVMDGMALVWVHAVRPTGSEEAFRAAVRRGRHLEMRKRILEGIQLRTAYDHAL